MPMKELPHYPLIVPERAHAMRRLLENQAGAGRRHARYRLGGLEHPVDHRSGVRRPGHAVFTAAGVAASARAAESTSAARRPDALSVLCLVNASHKPLTPLARQTIPLLAALVRELRAGRCRRDARTRSMPALDSCYDCSAGGPAAAARIGDKAREKTRTTTQRFRLPAAVTPS